MEFLHHLSHMVMDSTLTPFFGPPCSRRGFLISSSKQLVTLGLLGGLASCRTPQPISSHPTGEENSIGSVQGGKVELPPLDAPSEKPKEMEQPLPKEKRVGYAIVGLGHLALGEILPAFGQCKKSKVTALVSGNRGKALTVARQYGVSEKNLYDYTSYDSLKDNPEVDVIYIVLPNGLHAEYTIRGAKAGKHILCEKPMANSVKECEDMIAACQEANRKLMIAYRIQYEPNNAEIKRLIRSGKYGNVKYITATNGQNIGDPTQWRLNKKLAGGGSLPDVGIYCLNTIRYLLGEEPVEVFGQTYSTPNDPRFKEVEESVLFQMRFPSGVLASCTSSYGHHESRNYRVYAENAYMGMDPAFPYKGLKMYMSSTEGDKEVYQTPILSEQNQFALEMDHMSDCVLGDHIPYTRGEEGLQDQRIMEAIYASAKGKVPVTLPSYQGLDVFRG